MLRRGLLISLILVGLCFGESREADWWRRQVHDLFPPADVEVHYKAVHVDADQSIVIDSPSITFRDPENDQPALLTADRITLWPVGPLDPIKPLAMKAIRMDKPVLNLSFDAPPTTAPSTRPTTQPSLEPINELMESLRKVQIVQGTIIFEAAMHDHPAQMNMISVSAEQNDQHEWSGDLSTDLVPFVGTLNGKFKMKIEFKNNAIQIQSVLDCKQSTK